MLIFAVIMPIVVLIIIGVIFSNKPAHDGASYTFLQQSFGAIICISICAGGLMGLPIVISDYRSKNILKRFKVTPINPITILLVQVSIYTLYALISLISIIIISTTLFNFKIQGNIIQFFISWLLVVISMFSIGMMVGGIAKNTKIAGIIASALYFPMLIFSGATLPYEIMPISLQKVANILPLTQGIKILKATTLGLPIKNVFLPISIILSITIICSFISIKFFKWE